MEDDTHYWTTFVYHSVTAGKKLMDKLFLVIEEQTHSYT